MKKQNNEKQTDQSAPIGGRTDDPYEGKGDSDLYESETEMEVRRRIYAEEEAERKKDKPKQYKVISEEYVRGQKCRAANCGHKVMVRSVNRHVSYDGSTLRVSRYVKCTGPRRHGDTLINKYRIIS
jgi:hypothetical protein